MASPEHDETLLKRARRAVIGAPRDVRDSSLFHKLSLIPVLAWIGLGADGLSSSSYGPEEAFRTLGTHAYLAVFLALATALTVFIISYAYSRIIEHFPHGGGGYIVATHTIGEKAGVISGCALLVDYMLTITVSLVSCADALFSFVPMSLHHYKIGFVIFLIVLLVVLNARGVKESVLFLAPIFMVFVLTHIVLLAYGIVSHTSNLRPVMGSIHGNLSHDLGAIGMFGILALVLRAYSMGAGTYTGIEAVSNGLQIMREPRVRTGKRTMAYMASSLAITAGGLFVCYLLWGVHPEEGRTLNAILAGAMFAHWPLGNVLALVTILSEGALLLVAAQTGFIDGPRVMANMATDAWLPRRFSSLSERLTMQNGVALMGVAALLLLIYTKGSISALVVMYSINVFLTFSLSEFGMSRFFIRNRKREKKWKQHLPVHLTGFTLCVTILSITVYEKFTEGGWVTLLITSAAIGLCYLVKHHYETVKRSIRELDDILMGIPANETANTAPLDPLAPTAVLLTTGFNSFGLHTLLSIVRYFPGTYKNFVFVSVAEIDSGSFKGAAEVQALSDATKHGLEKYVKVTRRHGFPADYRMETATDVPTAVVDLCKSLTTEYSRVTVFTGQLIFHRETLVDRILHNQTAFAIQRRLQWEGIPTMIMPIRVKI
ncbi:MAG: APC family permease [Syntrophorhabdales bacterium]|jgi:amino acid transporter